ncbi:MAG: protease complex subunit PrcB family protein [Eubacteriales bacterium]
MIKSTYFWVPMMCIGMGFLLSACKDDSDTMEQENVPFVVISEECLPEELLELVSDEKEEAFKITYTDDAYLYICRGYGARATGGYSITIDQLYQTSNAIYIKTSLMGPSLNEQKNEVTSYPYVVVRVKKSEITKENVVFDS